MCKHIICILIAIGLLASCKRGDEPVEQTGTPVFNINATVNGLPVNLTAGVNDYFLFTDYHFDSRDVAHFKGTLAPKACDGCGPALTIEIRNYRKGMPIQIDSIDHQPKYAFYNAQKDIESYYQLSCLAQANGIGTPVISWNFGNNRFSGETNPTVKFEQSGVYNVAGAAVFPSNCFSILSQPIYLTPTRVGKNTNFTVNYPDTHTLLFNSLPVNPNAKVTWDFGDGQQGIGTIVSHTYAGRGLYRVCMEYQEGNDTLAFCKNVNTLDFNSCMFNYDYRTAYIVDSLHLSHVVVKWRDANGNVYSSDGVEQPEDSYFKITGADEYLLNDQQHATRKYTFELSCKAGKGNQTIHINKIKGVFGYAYPK